jgi:D-alanyl-D-alanine dipeptidase
MRTKIILCTIVIFSATFMSPVNAADVVDYCGNTKTGVITPISEGACASPLVSLGATPLSRGESRPAAIDPVMKNRFLVAKAAAKKKKYILGITSGWRSLEKQQALFDRAVRRNGSVAEATKWVLPPEKSNHPWGLAIDVNYGSGSRKATKWLETNGYKFGLCRRYKNEWWHFEPLVAPGQKCPEMENYAS